MTADLVAFLRDCLDDDERVAQLVLKFSRESYGRAGAEAWVAERSINHTEPPYCDDRIVRTERPGTVVAEVIRLPLDIGGFLTEHIARFGSPRRALAEIDAKRCILDRYEDALARINDPNESRPDAVLQVREYEDFILPALAPPYADRPGYDERWRP